MIKLANTEEQWKKCYDYLDSKGTPCLAETWLWYVEAENGEIIACAGWNKETGSAIEPFQAEVTVKGSKAAYDLFLFMRGYVAGKGFTTVRAMTRNNAVINVLEKSGFILWTDDVKEYVWRVI
jgi:hypothetical protein